MEKPLTSDDVKHIHPEQAAWEEVVRRMEMSLADAEKEILINKAVLELARQKLEKFK